MTQIADIFSGDETELHITATLGGAASSSTRIGELEDLSGLEETVKIIEAEVYGSALAKKKPGKHELPTITFKVLLKPSDAVHQQLLAAYDNKTEIFLSLVLRDLAENARVDMQGFVNKKMPEIPKDEFVKFEFEVTLTARPVYDWTTDALL